MNTNLLRLIFFLLLAGSTLQGFSQMITGVWKGRINRQKVEVKIIRNGDSLTGTSYYYESASNYRRYSIKGYFDQASNEAIWWDDQLLEEKAGRFSVSTPGKMPLLSRADFNCPGGGKMMLDGNAVLKEKETDRRGDLHLDKDEQPLFPDEWDYIIENYTTGGNDPYLIDSIQGLAHQVQVAAPPSPATEPVIATAPPRPAEKPMVTLPPPPAPVKEKTVQPEIKPQVLPPAPIPGIEDKFKTRQKQFIKEIQVEGDSIELRFFDNAEVDGDSISLFLNDRLLYQHIRLTAAAWSVKLPVHELMDTNELVMVAENMGSIPPNTSYMVAVVNGKRQDAYLASTEGSSAMIRLVKKPAPQHQ